MIEDAGFAVVLTRRVDFDRSTKHYYIAAVRAADPVPQWLQSGRAA
jgi:hypothetical protein